MARRIKQYRLRMTENEYKELEELSNKMGISKANVLRLGFKAIKMSRIVLRDSDMELLKKCYRGGFTHAVYTDTDSIKLIKGRGDKK